MSAPEVHCHEPNDDGEAGAPCDVCGQCLTCIMVGQGVGDFLAHLRAHGDEASLAFAKVIEALMHVKTVNEAADRGEGEHIETPWRKPREK